MPVSKKAFANKRYNALSAVKLENSKAIMDLFKMAITKHIAPDHLLSNNFFSAINAFINMRHKIEQKKKDVIAETALPQLMESLLSFILLRNQLYGYYLGISSQQVKNKNSCGKS